jgi:diaminohydroxyphosphoribosylaminopyrimidine deaminase/5-amino-6-(5-phosphoribosylamino)uracil reductase
LFDLHALDSLDRKHELAFHDVKQIGPDLRILARFT